MLKRTYLLLLSFSLLFLASSETLTHCEVIIAGGSTSAIAAALASANEGAITCLLEPTDWVGGQLTASAVSAVDFPWKSPSKGNQTFPISAIGRDPNNNSPNFYKILSQSVGNQGACWVSVYCFPPKLMLEKGLYPLMEPLEEAGLLHVYYNTVPKRVFKNDKGDKIVGIDAVQRTPRSTWTKCDLLADQLQDWYSEEASDRFEKTTLSFKSPSLSDPTQATWIVVEGTEWGEILALSEASYLQGLSESFDGDSSGQGGNDRCGQSIVFGLTEDYNAQPTAEPENSYPVLHPEYYSLLTYSWEQIWTYRRVIGKKYGVPQPGDLSLQNWGEGNDYPFGYPFVDRLTVKEKVQKDQWDGGVDIDVIRDAEWTAIGWHYAFKAANKTYEPYITLNKEALGTCHGLSKIPYMRETRRSIGLGGFIMKKADISGDFTVSPVASIPSDRVAIGLYNIDIHRIKSCSYPDYVNHVDDSNVLPFYIPFRALTNKDMTNLVVAGKAIAQSFLTNSATRLHPVEWNTGSAAGAAAAFMHQQMIDDTAEALGRITEIQEVTKRHSPNRWFINGSYYPSYEVA